MCLLYVITLLIIKDFTLVFLFTNIFSVSNGTFEEFYQKVFLVHFMHSAATLNWHISELSYCHDTKNSRSEAREAI